MWISKAALRKLSGAEFFVWMKDKMRMAAGGWRRRRLGIHCSIFLLPLQM